MNTHNLNAAAEKLREDIDKINDWKNRVTEHESAKGKKIELLMKCDSIDLAFASLDGKLHSYSVTPEEARRAIEEGTNFDGSSIRGYQAIENSDLLYRPDLETLAILPFTFGGAHVARMFGTIIDGDGKPYAHDPRNILISSLTRLNDYGLKTMNVGPEAEFYLFKGKEKFEDCKVDETGYFDPTDDNARGLREMMVHAMKSMGMYVECHHTEVGPSQHEIDLRYADALKMADQIMNYKWVVNEAALRAGLHATFMPKPLKDENGSGMHTHISLAGAEGNAFHYEKGLSETAMKFIEGVLQNCKEMCIVTNPTKNSYERLVEGYEAPVYIAWGHCNRSAAIRIPMVQSQQATRIELRFPDPTANPYLAFAVMLRAGMKGLDEKLQARPPESSNMYKNNTRLERLPKDLKEAYKCAERGSLLKEVLGESACENYKGIIEQKIREED